MATPRRNGQLSSCEPCRKSKLRCDHTSPVCGRCLRNDHAERCVYHPAPLTQPRPQPFRVPLRRPKRQRPDNQVVFRLDRKVLAPSDEGGTLGDQQIAQSTKTEKTTLRSGYLGLLSPRGASGEYEDLSQVGEPRCFPFITAPGDRSQGRHDPDKVHMGSQILSHLKHIHWFQEIIEIKNTTSPGWFLGPPLSRALCESMKRMYDSAVRGSDSSYAPLADLSRRIFGNTSKATEMHSEIGVSEYLDMIAARWETVGLLFALLGTALFYTADDDPIFTHRNALKIGMNQLSTLCNVICESCCQFCTAAGTSTDAFCWLATQHLVLLTAIFGDNGIPYFIYNLAWDMRAEVILDYKVWQKLGDLSTIVYASGLHQPDEDLDNGSPFWLLEMRKWAMACVYAIDKQLATSLGRPPRICSRYCHLPLPLDVSYDDMVAQSTRGNEERLKIDGEGWNIEGKFTIGSRVRVALLTSMLQESVLEVSFSPDTRSLSADVERLMKKSYNMQQSLPLFLRWPPADDTAYMDLSAQDEGRTFTHLEFTRQEFLLHRVLSKRLGMAPKSLIESALEVLGTLLDLIATRARSGREVASMSSDLCQMGLPAAGVIASQLLSEHFPQSPRTTCYPLLPGSFRSVAVQKLSIFVSHLTSLVRPQVGCFGIAQKGAEYIRSVLDQTLSTNESEEDVGNTDPEKRKSCDVDWNFMNEADFMAWCDSIHWPQDSLLEFA